MYTKPIIFKIYSILTLISGISCCGVMLIDIFRGCAYLKAATGNALGTGIGILLESIGAVLCLFFAYLEFTSMMTFADMIRHEESGSGEPFCRKAFVPSPAFFKKFGTAMFYLSLVISFLAVIVLIIVFSWGSPFAVVVVPLLPILLMLIGVVLVYVSYYCRYKSFGDLLEVKTGREPDQNTLNSLAESKPNSLRAYCIFMFAVAIINLVLCVIGMFFVKGNVLLIVTLLVSGIVDFILYGILGCFYDNLAKMLEHYLIKYELL